MASLSFPVTIEPAGAGTYTVETRTELSARGETTYYSFTVTPNAGFTYRYINVLFTTVTIDKWSGEESRYDTISNYTTNPTPLNEDGIYSYEAEVVTGTWIRSVTNVRIVFDESPTPPHPTLDKGILRNAYGVILRDAYGRILHNNL